MQKEAEEVVKDRNSISHNISMALESVKKSLKSCNDADAVRGKFKEVTMELDEIDKQLTIIGATFSSTTYWAVEWEDMVEDEVMGQVYAEQQK